MGKRQSLYADLTCPARGEKTAPARDLPGRMTGADNRTRTGDLLLTKEVLYLLSYISMPCVGTVHSIPVRPGKSKGKFCKTEIFLSEGPKRPGRKGPTPFPSRPPARGASALAPVVPAAAFAVGLAGVAVAVGLHGDALQGAVTVLGVVVDAAVHVAADVLVSVNPRRIEHGAFLRFQDGSGAPRGPRGIVRP